MSKLVKVPFEQAPNSLIIGDEGKEVMNLLKKIMSVIMLAALLLAAVSAAAVIIGAETIPDDIYVIMGETPVLHRTPYITIDFDDEEAVRTDAIAVGRINASAELFGVIPLKNIEINLTERREVVLCGIPVGIKLDTNGVVVAETTDILTSEGNINPGKNCGLQPGDCIVAANDKKIGSAAELISIVENSDGRSVKIDVIKRDGSKEILYLEPVFSETDGCYRAGIWIRSGTAGIGVLTFYDQKNGAFGGLGHAIYDDTSGAVINVEKGEITSVMLTEIVKGASGAPGELIGFLGDRKYGTLTQNTETGVYGYIESGFDLGQGEYEAALKQEIKEGGAQIMTSVPGSNGVQTYDIEIEKINYDPENPTRNMIVKVTDKALLELTGGIVQGMSGSPIIQDGRIVGAVTHVCVNL